MMCGSLLYFVVVFGTAVTLSSCQLVTSGGCFDDVHPMQNFDPSRFFGNWYVIAAAGYPFYEGSTSCDSWTFEPSGNRLDRWLIRSVDLHTGEIMRFPGRIKAVDGPNSANFQVDFVPRVTLPLTARNLTILNTDYDNWAALVACENHGGTSNQYAAVLSRNRTLDNRYLTNAFDSIQRNSNVPKNEYYMRNQEHCPTI